MTPIPTYKQGDRVSTPQGMGYIAGIYDHDPLHVNDYPVLLDGEDEPVPINKFLIRPETFWQFLWCRPGAFGRWRPWEAGAVGGAALILFLFGVVTWHDAGWVASLFAAVIVAFVMLGMWLNYTKRMV